MHAVMLDADTLGAHPDLSPLKQAVDTLTLFDNTPADLAVAHAKDADTIISSKVLITDEIIAALPKLKLICSVGTGTDHIAVEAARKHGVDVRNVKAFGSKSIAQHTMMLMLALAGNLLPYRHAIAEEGAWSTEVSFTKRLRLMQQLSGKKLTLVGQGSIGSEVARLAEAFGMQVRFSARPGKKEDDRPTLESLLPETDVLSLHCPLTPESEHLIDQRALDALPETALLINCARGKVIDNEAALAALKAGTIAGLGVDTLD